MFYLFKKETIVILLLTTILGCSKAASSSSSGTSYDFSATTSISITLKSVASKIGLNYLFDTFNSPEPQVSKTASTGPTLCSSTVCFTATKLTGTYYGSGFLIQSNGNGMVAYFGQTSWSDIVGTSPTYNFDSSAPITTSGDLTCCGGTGDLSNGSSYIESVIYLFGYLDATFTVSGVTGNTAMNREFTVRFVLADDAITSGKRGDLLLKDPADDVFKWSDTSGTLTTTRPTTPVTMNTSVTNWVNPFSSTEGNQTIPVIYVPALPSSETGVYSISDTDLKATGRSYTYKFDPTNFIMFPELQNDGQDINMISSYTQLLKKIHLGGLPHSAQSRGVGSPASTILTVSTTL